MSVAGSTSERGYGTAHQKLRAQVKRELVDPGLAFCWRCGRWINPGLPWDLGHDDEDRSLYRGPEHRRCNRSPDNRPQRRRRWGL